MGNLLNEVSALNGTVSYSYNTKNQLTSKTASDGAHTFTYDNAGNLLSEALNGATIKTLEYDATGRFVKGINANDETTEYAYNALGYRVSNTVTRANPNAAYANSANSGGSEFIGSVEDTIDAWNSSDFYTRIDDSGKSRQEEISVEEKIYVPDFTTGGLSDIFISVEGLYDQTLTWGLGLISVETVAAQGSGASVQQTIAAEYNLKAYAHSNRLGGVSYFTDADGELVTYNEFDAWGNAYTGQPDDANYSGLNVLTGFTGYTWDAVLDVYFAQARLYDAGSKRFVQADPVGGSVANPLSLNAYLYCRDDPVNNIDPTGMVMPGDEKRSEVDQAAIAAATFAWNKANAAGDAAGKAAAHAAAEYVRNNPSSGNTNINITPRVSGEKTNINNFPYPGMGYHSLPPSGTTVLMKALSVTSKKALSIDEIRKTANEWMVPVETVRRLQLTTVPVAPKPKPTVIAPIEPIPKLTAITPIEPIPKLLIPTESTIEASAQRKNGVSGALASVGGAFQSDIFRGSGEANAAYGEVNARLQAESKVSGKSGIIGVFGKASAGNAAGEIGIGNDSFSESLKGVGDVGTVSAQAGLQVKNGFGLALGAKATAVSGRATVEFNILGLEVEVGVTGYAGGVGGEIMAGYFPDEGFKIKADAIAIVGGGILFRVKP